MVIVAALLVTFTFVKLPPLYVIVYAPFGTLVKVNAKLPLPPQVAGLVGVAVRICAIDGSVKVTALPTTLSQYDAVPFLTLGVYVPAANQVNILLACQIVPFKLYWSVPLLVVALMVMVPFAHPQVVGFTGVTVLIVVTFVCAVTVKLPIPLHHTVVPVTLYTPVHDTLIVVPVAPLLHR